MATATRRPHRPNARPAPRGGRPRASGAPASKDTAEDILRAAAALFAIRGFVGTSTSQIAATVGLRQSAIFHWFPSKDAILEVLFARGWDRSLAYFSEVASLRMPAAVKLCICLRYDAAFVAGAEPYLKLMIVPPELHHPRFRALLRKRQRLISMLANFIAEAIEEGDFRSVDPARAARMVLAVDEVVLDAAVGAHAPPPHQHAEQVVDFVLHALAADKARRDRIRRRLAAFRRTREQ